MYKASETNIIDEEELKRLKDEMAEDEYEQEMECSFEAAIKGAYYGSLIKAAEKEGRITNVPFDPNLPVHTACDLGIGDDTVMWWFQVSPAGEIRIIDFYANSGCGLDHYINHLKSKTYVYGKHLAPHDINVRELTRGRSRKETAESLGINFEVVPKIKVDDGINAVRTIIPRCWFDKEKCKDGIEALKLYRRHFNEKYNVFSDQPLHDWCSHPADGFRCLAVGLHIAEPRIKKAEKTRPQRTSPTAWMGA